MEINNPNRHKSYTICNWKRSGVIYHDFDSLYEIYIKTMECGHCKKEFKNKIDRCLDHDHETGLFRKIVCHRCNANDNYLRFPDGYTEDDRKEYEKEYKEKNRDKIKKYQKEYSSKNRDKIKEYLKEYHKNNKEINNEKKREKYQLNKEKSKERYQLNKDEINEKSREKITCECGAILSRAEISKHKKRPKHARLMEQLN